MPVPSGVRGRFADAHGRLRPRGALGFASMFLFSSQEGVMASKLTEIHAGRIMRCRAAVVVRLAADRVARCPPSREPSRDDARSSQGMVRVKKCRSGRNLSYHHSQSRIYILTRKCAEEPIQSMSRISQRIDAWVLMSPTPAPPECVDLRLQRPLHDDDRNCT